MLKTCREASIFLKLEVRFSVLSISASPSSYEIYFKANVRVYVYANRKQYLPFSMNFSEFTIN